MVFNFFIALPKRNFPDFLASTPKSQPRPPAPPGCSVTALAVRKSYSDFHTGPAASRRRKAPRLFTSAPSFRFQKKPPPTLWGFPPSAPSPPSSPPLGPSFPAPQSVSIRVSPCGCSPRFQVSGSRFQEKPPPTPSVSSLRPLLAPSPCLAPSPPLGTGSRHG